MCTSRVLHATILMLTFVLAISSCSLSSPEAKKTTHRERGLAYFEKGQVQEAIIEFKNVVQIDPKDANGHYRLALAYLKLGGVSTLLSAFDEFSKTTEIDPTNPDAQLKLGELSHHTF